MSVFELIDRMGHEQVLFCSDPECGYRSIIAIHSTVPGPAVGGTRFWNYSTEREALIDALRLSRGMTYKAAVAGLDFGGGKSVIIGDNRRGDREALFRAHGRFVDRLGGRYITAEDVGTNAADMEFVSRETKYVGGLVRGGGDPSPWTALGVFRGIQAAAKHKWGSDDLADKKVAVQGCGNVGYWLAKELHTAGALLTVCDIDPQRVRRIENEFSGAAVSPDKIFDEAVDIFSPCALGGIINDATIPRLKAQIIAGAANNQLLEDRHGDALESRGILYSPDYVVNGGGLISGGFDFMGWDREQVKARVLGIYDTLLEVFAIADEDKVPSYKAADRLAEKRLTSAKKRRSNERERTQNA